MAALLTLAPVIVHAAPTQAQTDAAAVVMTSVKGASKADRARLVREAIAADPEVAGALIAALITEYPGEAAAYTETVVTAILAIPETSRNTEAKASILTSVAEAAVPAALLIPSSRVDSVVQSVNAVKAALAQVAATNPLLANAVASFTAPLVEGDVIILNTGENQQEVIVSGDTLFPTT